ncbi:MAG: thermonuclease family protein [Deltaproteobacteria bacterium]|nr:thermonuclease family protein [Deltaproteobacteria bacterium]MBW2219944.1 thermonuclease family protein [Deltaproteobacteria bacterium]
MKKSISIFFLALLYMLCLCDSSFSQGKLYHVKWVDDGDTIVLSDGRRIRYIGINAPETDHFKNGNKTQRGERFGQHAKKYNEKLVHLKKVRLEFDHEKYDRYGRLLAYVFLKDNSFINEKIVQAGLAYCLSIKPNLHYSSRLLKAQRGAIAQRKNIWKKLENKKGAFVGNQKSMRFHLPSCQFGKKTAQKNRVAFKTVYDAFYMGFAPCMKCRPNP